MSIQSERAISRHTGVHRSESLAALNAGIMRQYDREHALIRSSYREFGYLNAMYIINNSDENIAIDLDFTTDKRYIVLAKSEKGIDMVKYIEFNVTNISATNTSADEVVITVMFERPLMRER